MALKQIFFTMGLAFFSTHSLGAQTAQKLASIKGTQITGVTVSDTGDVFVNAPTWRNGVEFAVAKISDTGHFDAYPNKQLNSCVASARVSDDCFLAVQSVVAHKDKLYVLDTRNPQFKGVKDSPRIFVINLEMNKLESVLTLSSSAYHSDSYINDLRVDDKTNRIYMTDSGHAGLVIYNLDDNSSYRILDNHPFTRAETSTLNIAGKLFTNTVHSDGLALDSQHDTVYFHALSGYTLYAIKTDDIKPISNDKIASKVRKVATTGAPDGLIYHDGILYLADLEKQLVQYLTPDFTLHTLVDGDAVNWADTFSIHNVSLYYTNSKIQDAGSDVSQMEFEVYKVALPSR
ncbi:major royal jelly family protein [Alteromonas stellipolaris]|uniref:major royal jelly family protein n=1 Tax=Alteromonas stellipolaris TaxID=233316 RepID=UPI001E03B53C|nr:major royal jelly family protein [Alteromonas stellipolaris]MBZ2162018.1 hypothetical protein [Alteromonas stellipolaris]MDO6533101.1 L-dopachrome tautomerase-related protein [Alteromonas stellipolaris]MDO6624904.1 L-dopachrome tautomerase-related protein [Alteromonas stellipolaris]